MEKKIFADVSEKEITRSIASMFFETIQEYSDSDVIILGAGPAGLSAGREIAKKRHQDFDYRTE